MYLRHGNRRSMDEVQGSCNTRTLLNVCSLLYDHTLKLPVPIEPIVVIYRMQQERYAPSIGGTKSIYRYDMISVLTSTGINVSITHYAAAGATPSFNRCQTRAVLLQYRGAQQTVFVLVLVRFVMVF